ncbi:PAS domain S-box protein [Schlesneria paludicola]|uniref:PAS domain S-box protein n=1 Tax=Schlesneria paludicola TaxID=360056 RepID=UPI000299F66E|nr:PAS domain S-box protein [Schlesneria paludicola]
MQKPDTGTDRATAVNHDGVPVAGRSLEQYVQNLEAENSSLREIISQSTAEQGQNSSSSVEANEACFRLLVESVKEYAIFMLDPEGRIVSWNEGARRIKGYEASEILGRHFSCFYRAEDLAQGKPEEGLTLASEHGHFSEESLRVRKSGEVYWASIVITPLWNSAGRLKGFAKVTRDISERKRAEEKTRLMVELAINAMILVDRRGLIVLANPQTQKLFGYTADELIGQPVEILVPQTFRSKHPSQREKFFAHPTVRAMGAGRDLFGCRKDGTEFPVEIGLNPIHTSEELLVLGSIVDITERKKAEDKSRRHLAELAHAGRLSTVGEMFSGLAHEINQPLAAAANYARASVRIAKSYDGEGYGKLLEWMEKTVAQAERASEIVNRLGTFVKKDRSIRTDVDLNRLIENVIALPILLISKAETFTRPRIRLELEHGLPTVVADKVQIEQVIVNLIRNGMEAMLELPSDRSQLEIRTMRQGDVIQISISDHGHGIPVELQAQLFSPFFTTKAEGMGLGLSISRSIIETHQGQMLLLSSSESGTTFAIRLPIDSRATENREPVL